eukprot:GHVU01141971.1.p2 GENE.GHVU01141971.1~~GHVU01141971.1.p2  ORF type:complete len:107 (-),score=6.59 GHVU01141971.1:530-850(-)
MNGWMTGDWLAFRGAMRGYIITCLYTCIYIYDAIIEVSTSACREGGGGDPLAHLALRRASDAAVLEYAPRVVGSSPGGSSGLPACRIGASLSQVRRSAYFDGSSAG